MKRILALSLSAALLLALLGACTGADSETTVIPSDSAGESATVPPTDNTQEPSLALPSEEPSAEPSDEPSDEPSQEPSQDPATQPPTPSPTPTPTPTPTPKPTPSPTPEPTPTPTPEAPSIDLDRFFNTLSGKYGFPESMMHLDIDVANNFYPGLANLDLVQCHYYIPATTGGSNVTEIVLIQAADASNASAAAAILQDRINRQTGPGSMLYPQDRVAWTDYSHIKTKGNYVMLVVNQNFNAIVSDFNALF